jgi:hypothetical protein
MAKAKRYGHILGLIEEVKPKTIIEIGVWNGGRACEMALAALTHNDAVHYTGYDLFEDATDETNQEELNAKRNCTVDQVRARLASFQAQNPGFAFGLVKGNTRETLDGLNLEADFVYIDGGHSVETIRSDYEAVKASPCVVFDDYYLDVPEATLDLWGANRVLQDVPHEVIDTRDPLKMGDVEGVVALGVVRRTISPEASGETDEVPAKMDLSSDHPMDHHHPDVEEAFRREAREQEIDLPDHIGASKIG